MNQLLKCSIVQRASMHKVYSHKFRVFLICLLSSAFGSASSDVMNSFTAFATSISTGLAENYYGTTRELQGNTQPATRDQNIPLPDQGNRPPRMLAGGEVHNYRIQLTSRQYIRVAITPKGIDTTLTLYGPDGRKLQEVDTPKSTESIKSIMWISETAGTYHLQVRPSNPDTSAGKYDIVIRSLLPVSEQNKNYIQADRLTAEGWRLHEIGTEEALRKAIELFTEAIPHWHTVGN